MSEAGRIPISIDDCICNLDGSQDTNTFDGCFTPRADCPVHGLDADRYYLVDDSEGPQGVAGFVSGRYA